MDNQPDLSRVVITISAYNSDDSVMGLLEQLFADQGDQAAAVIVVDSENEGHLERRIQERGFAVRYVNSPVNLGSAGNLARRLELAAYEEADWCFAINHDGMFESRMVEQLLMVGAKQPRVGAVYPRRRLIARGDTVLQPHRSFFRMPAFSEQAGEATAVEKVAWDSSNGALYALEPVRQGLLPWSDLWMGWEDLAYGWSLSKHGWSQLYCRSVEFRDNYEYEAVNLLGWRTFITKKPPWYGYYQIRNLMIIGRRTRGGLAAWSYLLRRLLRELGFALFIRREKAARLRYLWRGLADGVTGVTGRGFGR